MRARFHDPLAGTFIEHRQGEVTITASQPPNALGGLADLAMGRAYPARGYRVMKVGPATPVGAKQVYWWPRFVEQEPRVPSPSKQLHLCAFPHTGPLSWRQPNVRAEGDMDLNLYVQIAQTAERGLFDALFLGDNLCLNDWLTGLDAASRIGNTIGFEPFTLLGGLAMVTQNIGLMATASTTYNQPYHIARKFASLDHMTGGRAGWNVVTSNNVNEAANFGLDASIESVDRYVIANEFVDVVNALWDSWADDAFIRDRRSGEYYDLAKLRMGPHMGAHFKVAGPLNVSRSPQGRPVLCQAGRSEAGMDLAARTAELIFNNQHSAEASGKFRQRMRARAVGHGRGADDIRFMAGVFVVVGGTEDEARRKMRDARDAVDMPTSKRFLQPFLPSLDLEALDFDAPLPIDDKVLASAKSAGMVLEDGGRRLSMRELCTSYGNQWRQLQVVGAAEQVADLMTDWFAQDAADGFNVFTLGMPGGFEDFVDGVVPELQRRGVYRTEYAGKTLRENLGIARPGLA